MENLKVIWGLSKPNSYLKERSLFGGSGGSNSRRNRSSKQMLGRVLKLFISRLRLSVFIFLYGPGGVVIYSSTRMIQTENSPSVRRTPAKS